MIFYSKRKLLTTIFLLALLVYSVYAILMPNVQASEIIVEQKGQSLLSNLMGVDSSQYSGNAKEYPQDSYLGVIPEENIRYKLYAEASTIEVFATFVNGYLRILQVLDKSGAPITTKSVTSPREMAIDFLENYRNYSGNAFYGELKSTLTSAELNRNITSTSGNVKLEVTTSSDSETFRWTYQYNGIEAPDKCVVLGYKNGFLEYFIDNWALYKIGSTSVNISESQAIDIGMERAGSFFWEVGSGNTSYAVKNFNVTNAMVWETVFCSNLYADEPRSNDPLMLYPMRHIWVSLDKIYPGNVYGIEVYVWADTGKICHIQERFSTLDLPGDQMANINDPADNSTMNPRTVDNLQQGAVSITWILFPTLALVLLFASPLWFGRMKKRSLKIGVIMLCLLTLSMALLMPIAIVSANSYRGRFTVWGSESTGADDRYPPDSSSWRKTGNEITQQQTTAQNITSSFSSNGYYATNYQGSGSIKAQILSNISYNEANYPRVAVVDFDHGVGNAGLPGIPSDEWHYMFEDNRGTYHDEDWYPEDGVYDYQIYEKTSGKTNFAFINTCLSACINNTIYDGSIYVKQELIDGVRARGMPFAWTHRLVNWKGFANFSSTNHVSMFGYSDPDNSPYCYIGFSSGSAALCQTVQTGSAAGYHTWVEKFFAYALQYDFTVNQALDHASCDVFSYYFSDTDLYTGFDAEWPTWNGTHWNTPQQWIGCSMAVYGNGNIKLYQPSISFSGASFTVDSQQGFTGSYKLSPTVHSFTVPDLPNYDFSYISYNNHNYYYRPTNIPITVDGQMVAHYVWDPKNTLSISSSGGGYVADESGYPISGCINYSPNSDVDLDAVADSGWTFDHWVKDSVDAGANPSITIHMDTDHVVQALFNPGYHYYVSSVEANEYVSDKDYLAGSQNDDYFACLPGDNCWEYRAVAVGTMNDESQGDIWINCYNEYGREFGRFTVEVKLNEQDEWSFVGEVFTVASSPVWIEIADWPYPFNYIRIAAEDGETLLWVDSVAVVSSTPRYGLTVYPSDYGGTDLGVGEHRYYSGNNVYVTAVFDSGYILDYWYLDSVPAGSSWTICVPIDGDHTLQPVFRQATNYYDLTIGNDGNGYTSPSGVQNVLEGTYADVYAYPNSGYHFNYWTLNGSYYDSGDGSHAVVPIDGDYTLIAYFEENPPNYLTVSAFEYPDTPVEVDFNIDYSYAGTTYTAIPLPSGEHVIDFPYYLDSWSGWYFDTDVTINDYVFYQDGNSQYRWGIDYTASSGTDYYISAFYITGK
jgi:hypothetical protein